LIFFIRFICFKKLIKVNIIMQDNYIAIELFNLPELDQLHILLWAGDTLLFQFCPV